MARRGLLIDLVRCTGCRGCQVACKQWNGLPAEPTHNAGVHQNPPHLSPDTWCLLRMDEGVDAKGSPYWLFRRQACHHCADPACMRVCPVPGCITKNENGTVILNSKLCMGCKYCVYACPFGIPQYDPKRDRTFKCNQCYDRVAEGQIPACAKTCPTQAIQFGDREALVKDGQDRVAKLKEQGYADARLYGEHECDGLNVMYVLPVKAALYSALPENPSVPLTIMLWKDILKPLTLLAGGAAILGALAHYIFIGPKIPWEKHDHK